MVEYCLECKRFNRRKANQINIYIRCCFLLAATKALNRILSNLEEEKIRGGGGGDVSDVYESTRNVKFVLESPLFINLYNIQTTLKKFKLQNDNNGEEEEMRNKMRREEEAKEEEEEEENNVFKTIKLERKSISQTFGFTIILIQHPESEIGETFVFIQDVDENSIAA